MTAYEVKIIERKATWLVGEAQSPKRVYRWFLYAHGALDIHAHDPDRDRPGYWRMTKLKSFSVLRKGIRERAKREGFKIVRVQLEVSQLSPRDIYRLVRRPDLDVGVPLFAMEPVLLN